MGEPVPDSSESAYARRWFIFSIVALGIFLASSGNTGLNVALPFISQDFRSDITTTQWVMLAYLLTTSSLLINAGRLGDVLGHFRVHYAGFVVFTIFSLLCGIAPSERLLIVLRVFQALGGAMLIANGPSIITSIFPPEQRGKALGLQATVVGGAISFGPTLGGFLIGLFGWRAIFLFYVPLGILGAVLSGWARLPGQPYKKLRVDFWGTGLLSASIVSVILSLNRARQIGWLAPATLGLIGLFLACLSAFVVVERHRAHPMLDLRLFRNRLFTLAQIGNFVNHMAVFGILFLFPFFLVQILRLSAEMSGLMLLPLTTIMIIMGPITGSLADRFGTRWLSIAGMLTVFVGLYSLTSLREDSSTLAIVVRLALLGLGRTLYQSPNLAATMSAVEKESRGLAGGIYATMRHLGNMCGTAVLASYVSYRQSVYAGGADATALQPAGNTSASMAAFSDTFRLAAGIALIGLVTALAQKELKLSGSRPPAVDSIIRS